MRWPVLAGVVRAGGLETAGRVHWVRRGRFSPHGREAVGREKTALQPGVTALAGKWEGERNGGAFDRGPEWLRTGAGRYSPGEESWAETMGKNPGKESWAGTLGKNPGEESSPGTLAAASRPRWGKEKERTAGRLPA